MLQSLTIHNFAIIDRVHIEFEDGFSVLTGETGAGKSILLDALGLILGNRAQGTLIRTGADQATITGVFSKVSTALQSILQDTGLSVDDTIIIRRTFTAAGKNQIFINDQPASLQLLADIAPHLVEIHGQFDRLLHADNHLKAVDAWAKVQKDNLYQTYADYKKAKEALVHFQKDQEAREQKATALKEKIAYLKLVNPKAGEEAALLEKRSTAKSMQHMIDLKNHLDQLFEETNAFSSHIRKIQGAADKIQNHRIEFIKKTADTILIALRDLEETGQTLEDLIESDSDINQIEERLFALREAGRRFHIESKELLPLLHTLEGELNTIQEQPHTLDEARIKYEQNKSFYLKEATACHEARIKSGQILLDKMKDILEKLKLPHAKLVLSYQDLDEPKWHKDGTQSALFLVSTNPGINPGPLHKVASGGERSRIMLALKSLIHSDIPTLIFDEIDIGLGGSVATAMGDMLKALSKKGQVLSVTHSPQLAACANHHFRVEKKIESGNTTTEISSLSAAERIEELSRMLSGKTINEESVAAAKALLKDGALL